MEYIEAPKYWGGEGQSLFIAGGITDCPDWQKDLIEHLKDTGLVLLNPRRRTFNTERLSESADQIKWEHLHLKKADAVSFWFPKETLCPITLYELGTWSAKGKKIFVGVHPEYRRRKDVEVQTALARPDVTVVYDIKELSKQIKNWAKQPTSD